jgi:hypothetical protein
MNWRAFIILLIGFCLTSWTLAEYAEARGGGRGGGGGGRGGGSRGGGGFSRGGGGGGSHGSIRNSARPSTRDISRPSTGAVTRPSQGQVSDRMATQRPAGGDRLSQGLPSQLPAAGSGARPSAGQQPAKGGDRLSQAQRPSQLPAGGSAVRPSQQPAGSRGENLSSSQKNQLRQKYQESGGLKPSQLPSRDRDQAREDWNENREERREDWQDYRDDVREDWQDYYHDHYHDDWDDDWYSPWWYGYPVSTVSFAFYMDNTPPCSKTVVINQTTGQTTYYYCNSVWYQPAYNAGEVKYIVTAPPAGAELPSIPSPHKMTVGGKEYYLSNHVFYQQITRDGQTLYVTVDAPPGAKAPSIPEYAVEIEHQGQSYYRFDKIFYVKQGDAFVVVKNPGV